MIQTDLIIENYDIKNDKFYNKLGNYSASISTKMLYNEINELIKIYINNKIEDVDTEMLGYYYNVNSEITTINGYEDDIYNFMIFKKDLKRILGNNIINTDNEIDTKILLRRIFSHSKSITFNENDIIIVYDIGNINELNKLIDLIESVRIKI